jgi:hypothetical protein
MDINITTIIEIIDMFVERAYTASTVAFLGIALTFVVGIINVIFTVRMFQKKTFLKAVTAHRMKYLEKLRALMAKFCYLATTKPKKSRLKELGYQMKLMMNPAGDKELDRKAVKLIDSVINRTNQKKRQRAVNTLEKLMQSWFVLEWNGIKKEAQKGVLTDIEIKELRNKILREYEKYK